MGLMQVCIGVIIIVIFSFSESKQFKRSPYYQGRFAFGTGLSKTARSFNQPGPTRYQHSSPVFTPLYFPHQFPGETPFSTNYGRPAQDVSGVQAKEMMGSPLTSLKWKFPIVLEDPQRPEIPFEIHYPLPSDSVAALCGENSIYVEVKEDFFGTGKPLMSSGFSLGGCAPTGEDPLANVLAFEYDLHDCASTSVMTDRELVYLFSLIYTPQEATHNRPIVRSRAAIVGIECHYPRAWNVSSGSMLSSWIPYASTSIAEDLLVFSLRLMTDDWRFERTSNQYFLGDFMNFEAAVVTYHHIPLRIFIDQCVATSVPGFHAVPGYSFIENKGCLVDARLTGSGSMFMPRTEMDKLQFRLESFRFQEDTSETVYITCVLKVAAVYSSTSVENKACSFTDNRWVSADEDDRVCGCCESTCVATRASDPFSKAQRWDTATIGPISVKNFAQM